MPTALEEKDAIREVLAEYCFRLDDSQFTEMAALFTADGSWDTAFDKVTGRAAIADLARSLRERAEQPRPRAIHLTTNIAIDLLNLFNTNKATGFQQNYTLPSGGAYLTPTAIVSARVAKINITVDF